MMWQVGEELGWPSPEGRSGKAPRTALEEGHEYGEALKLLVDVSEQIFEADYALRKVRFHLKTTAPWLQFGHTLEALSTKAKSLAEFRPLIDQFFSGPQEMVPKTTLRQ